MKFLLLARFKLTLIFILNNYFLQSNGYHLQKKNTTNTEKVISFNENAKTFKVKSYSDGTHVCKPGDCGANKKCVGGVNYYTCECIDGYMLDGNGECIKAYVCKEDDCIGVNTICVPHRFRGYTCNCLDGYVYEDEQRDKWGRDSVCIKPEERNVCERDKDTCDRVTSECIAVGLRDFYCKCKDGYIPKIGYEEKNNKEGCITAHVCTSGDCPSASTKCIPKRNDFYCRCAEGYRVKAGREEELNKDECEQQTICDKFRDSCDMISSDCVAEGFDDFSCKCKDGYKKESGKEGIDKEKCIQKHICEKDNITTCDQTSTICVPLGLTDFYCLCKEGFKKEKGNERINKEKCREKTICEKKEDDCDRDTTVCTDTENNSYYCKCKPNYVLPDGAEEKYHIGKCTRPCDCGRYSHGCKRNGSDNQICYCYDGYAQNGDNCSECYCGKHSLDCNFYDIGHKTCKCPAGYAQRNMTCAAMCRSNNDCLNGGICMYEGNGYFCKCKEHYKGDKCEINAACDSMVETCEAIGAVCTFNELLGKGFCVCPSNSSFNRELKTCEDICKPWTCAYGKCEVTEYHKECRCYEGYEGDNCDKKIETIIEKIKGKLDLSIILISVLATVTCFIIITFCFLVFRKIKMIEKLDHCKHTS